MARSGRPPDGDAYAVDEEAAPADRLWFLADHDAFARRFILAELLGPPPGLRRWRACERHGAESRDEGDGDPR